MTPPIARFIAREAPDAIVVAAAERRPDVCENDPALARALNVDALRSIASAARERGRVGAVDFDRLRLRRHASRPISPPIRPRRSTPTVAASSKANAR